jgi:hypothetical protein
MTILRILLGVAILSFFAMSTASAHSGHHHKKHHHHHHHHKR